MPNFSEIVRNPAAVWAKPELVKIGTLADVSNNPRVVAVQNPGRS